MGGFIEKEVDRAESIGASLGGPTTLTRCHIPILMMWYWNNAGTEVTVVKTD